MQLLVRRQGIRLWLLLLLSVMLSGCVMNRPSEEEAEAAWSTSAHADIEARSFTHWNEADPAEVPERCANCHSTPGYLDYLGADGSTPGQVDQHVFLTLDHHMCRLPRSAASRWLEQFVAGVRLETPAETH